MSERNEQSSAKKPLKLRGKLELRKTIESGQVRQSFPHGRSKTVQVERKKARRVVAPAPGAPADAKTAEEAAEPSIRKLTEEEKAARLHAVLAHGTEEEKRRLEAAEEAKRLEEEARRNREEQERRKAEEERRKAEEEVKRKAEEEARRREEAETSKRAAAPAAPEAEVPVPTPQVAEPAAAPEEAEPRKKPGKSEAKRKSTGARGEPRRRAGKLTISQALEEGDGNERVRSLASVRRQREREKQQALESLQSGEIKKTIREVVIPESISVQDLAQRMAVRGADVVKSLMKMGVMATINQVIDTDTAELIVEEFGHRAKRVSESDVEVGLTGTEDAAEHMAPRAPVVTVMGHVDHGKTSLLDALRQSDVAAKEAGGITQHIGAYQITVNSGDHITFIDTPGHAAFSEMRARGANVTDLVVLVVAADDGVMEQTKEAIAHAKAAEVPMIVAINKCDRPDATPDRVRTELLSEDIQVESMGGEVLDVEVSAVAKTGLEKLEEAILLQSELLELKANPKRTAVGTVIEAKLEQGRGPVATVLVERGTLRVGDIFVAGAEWGRVRAMINDRGQQVKEAGPSVPVEVLGLQGTPLAGDDLIAVENEARAREVADFRTRQRKQSTAAGAARSTVEQMFQSISAGEAKELPIVIKGDVQGSVEAIATALERLATEEVKVRVLHTGVGGINESDVTLANASDGFIIGFNVRANPQARALARRDGVDIRYYSVIYNVIDDAKGLLSGMLAPTQREVFLGNAEIREVFSISKTGKVAGCYITEGMVKRGAKVRLLRDDVVIHEGALKTLRRFKEDVREVKEGYECGMAFESYSDIQVGDVIECFELEEVARAL